MVQMQNSNSQHEEISAVEKIQNWLLDRLSEQLSLESNAIDIKESLTRYGLDSIDAVTLVGDLEDWLDLELPATLFWDYPTIAKSAQYLAENFDISAELNSDRSEDIKTESEPASNGKAWGGFWGKISGK